MEPYSEIRSIEALLPPEMAGSAEEIGISKARMGLLKTGMLAILAGAFITFGAIFSTVVSTGSTLSFGLTGLLSGLTFSLGLVVKEWSDPGMLGFLSDNPDLFNELSWGNFISKNLLPVSLGNIVGGSLFVGIAYWFIYSSKWNNIRN